MHMHIDIYMPTLRVPREGRPSNYFPPRFSSTKKPPLSGDARSDGAGGYTLGVNVR